MEVAAGSGPPGCQGSRTSREMEQGHKCPWAMGDCVLEREEEAALGMLATGQLAVLAVGVCKPMLPHLMESQIQLLTNNRACKRDLEHWLVSGSSLELVQEGV